MLLALRTTSRDQSLYGKACRAGTPKRSGRGDAPSGDGITLDNWGVASCSFGLSENSGCRDSVGCLSVGSFCPGGVNKWSGKICATKVPPPGTPLIQPSALSRWYEVR